MKRFLPAVVFFVCLFPFRQGFAQQKADHPVRIEIPAKSDDESHKIIPCGPSGVVLFFQSVEKVNDTLTKWYFSLYDQNLKPQWLKFIPLPSNMQLKDFRFLNNQVVLLFMNTSAKEKTMKFQVVRLTIPDGTFKGNTGNLPPEADFVSFSVIRENALIGFNEKNEAAKVKILDMATGISAIFPWNTGNASTLTGLEYDSISGKILGYVKKQWVKNKYEFYVVEMDLSGKISREVLISDQMHVKYILDLHTVSLNEREMIAYGGYSSGLTKSAGKNLLMAPATGFYFFRISGDVVQKSSFINFLSMSNAAFTGDREIGSLKKKVAKKGNAQVEYSLDYPVIIHPLTRYKDQWMLLGETFTPQFHTESYTDFDFYGRPFTNSFRVFDGYRFTRGILAGLDNEGNLVWDNSLEILNLVSFDLSKKVNIFLTGGDNLALSFLSQGKIGYKIIKADQVLEKLDFSPLEMMNPEDKLLDETKSNMIRWYDHYFLCSGYQQVKNINAAENKKRMVFYFEKVRFQ